MITDDTKGLQCGPDPSWRFVYSDKEVLMQPTYVDGYLTSIYNIYEASTEEECLYKIQNL